MFSILFKKEVIPDIKVWVGADSLPPIKNYKYLIDNRSAMILIKKFENMTYLPIQKMYNNFPHDIMRADLIRLIACYIYGGSYADIKIEKLSIGDYSGTLYLDHIEGNDIDSKIDMIRD